MQWQVRLSNAVVGALAPNGKTGRRAYLTTGILLTALKYNLDRWIAAKYGISWSGTDYFVRNQAGTLLTLTPGEQKMYLTLAAIALPFVLIGILLTVRRLRDAGLSPWLVFLFFVPVVNLLFFAVLSTLPARSRPDAWKTVHSATPTQPPLEPGTPDVRSPSGAESVFYRMERYAPKNVWQSAGITVLLIVPFALLFVAFGANVLQNYGWGLFVGAPFSMGLIAAILHGLGKRRTLAQCQGVGILSLLLISAALFAVAVEGAICIAMALPITAFLSLLGGTLGYFIQNAFPHSGDGPQTTTRISCTLLVLLPLLMNWEAMIPVEAELLPVRTEVIVNAPPEHVWPNIIAFPKLPRLNPMDPSHWLFFSGVAHPIGAHIEGQGVGAVRYCQFSTGPFVEPIDVWDAPNLLAFRVVSQPPPMRELSPYPGLHPPHMDNFLLSEKGQFLLTRLPDGRTRVEGTTWYRNRMWPAAYWRFLSDQVIHRIHGQVLHQVKRLSETAE